MESPQLSHRTIGNYELLTKISQGGMGEVFLGRQLGAHGFSRLVAVKVIRAEIASLAEARSSFFDEAQLSARLAHPGIAQVIDFGESEGALYLVMEFVAGVSFSFLAKRQPRLLPPAQIARLMGQVCRALHAAHEACDDTGRPLKVVHRDVSPQNLLLTFGGTVKIIDFGIAKMLERRGPETQHGLLKGKPRYVAPEQITLGESDRRTDLWACAVVTYELLTGKGLFLAPTDWATLNAVITRDVPAPSTLVGPLPAGLDALVLRGLRREPAERFSSGLQMATAFDAIAAEERAPPLEGVLDRALAEEKARHQAWLGELTEGLRAPAMLATPTPLAEEKSRDTLPMRPKAPPQPPPGTPPDEAPRARWPWLALVVALPLAGSAWWWSREPAPTAVVETPAAVEPPPVAVHLTDPVVEPDPPPPAEAPKPLPPVPRRPVRGTPAPASTKAPTPALAVGEGTITIGAVGNYALVRVDGVMLGPTPLIDHRLTEGAHLLEWLTPDTNEVRERRKVTIRVGQHTQETIR